MNPAKAESPTVLSSDSLVPLKSVLCTEELTRRPTRPPDYEKENRALVSLAEVLTDSPRTILQKLADTILEVFQADSAGISLLTKDEKRFYWPAIAGVWKPHIGGGTPREFGPCGDVLDRNAPLLFRHFERRYTYFLPVTPPVEECLLVPFYVEGRAVGTIWAIVHDDRRKFDAEDMRQLVSLGRFASSAYQAVAFLDALEQREEALRQSHTELAQRMAELQKANTEVHDSRRAALNLMEDAVQSRQAMETLNRELRESEERYRTLFASAPMAVFVCDRNAVVQHYNQRAVKLLGREPVCGVEQHCGSVKLWLPDGTVLPLAQSPMVEVLRTGVPADNVEVFIERPDGSRLPVLVNFAALKNAEGEITGAITSFMDITELKRAEEIEIVRRQAELLDLANDAIMLWDIEHDAIRYWNKGAERLYGWTVQEAVGVSSHTLFRTVFPKPFHEIMLDLFQAGQWEGELVHTKKDGTRITVLSRWKLVFDPNGRLSYSLESNSDISDRQRAEAALREAHEKLHIIMQASPLAILGIDPAGRIMSWNGGAERMFGWNAREAIGQICPTVAPEWLEDFHDMIARVMQGESITGLVRYRQKRDGTVIIASLSSARLRNVAGEAMGIIVILEDITERIRAEDTLREINERFSLAVAGVKDYAIFMLDPDGHIVSCNAGAERIKGYQADEIIGQHFSRFYSPEALQDGIPERELQVAAAEGRYEDEGWRVRKDGTRFWANVIITAVRDEAGTLRGFLKMMRDLTNRKRAEDLLKLSLQEVRSLDHRLEGIREEERTRIAREIHDELGVTLTCLKMDLARLSAMASDSPTAEGLARMKDKVQSLIQQTDGTITQVQRIATELRPGILDDFGLVAALEWQTQDFQGRTGIACQFRSGQEEIPLDKNRATAIFRICQEALTNVARHARATKSTIELTESAGRLVVEVRDNGMGLPEGKILDPHSLGLRGMRERVLPFGGELFLQGIPGEGTTIRVVMPLVAEQPGGKPQ